MKLNSMAENSWLRMFMKLIGKPELDRYYREYYELVKEAMAEFDRTGIDRLFHGAPSAIVVGCKAGAYVAQGRLDARRSEHTARRL